VAVSPGNGILWCKHARKVVGDSDGHRIGPLEGNSMRFQVELRIIGEHGEECGALVSQEADSPQAAARDVVGQYERLRKEANLANSPVGAADQLKSVARRFGA
jgi:hypothetical protein